MIEHDYGPGAPERGAPRATVCVPLYGAHDEFVQCLGSILRHTPTDVPVLVADDAGPDPASEAWVRNLDASGVLRHRVLWRRQEENRGFVLNCNDAFAACGQDDVVLVNSDVVVAAGWFAGLRDAAYSDSLVATATALTNHGSIVSVPDRNRPSPRLPQSTTLDDAAAGVLRASQRLRPELPTAIGHCVWLRRDALDLVGGFDPAFSPGYGEEVDYSQRCILRGLRHVLADDVLVLHHGQASLGVARGRNPIQDEHERIIRARYPYYVSAVEAAESDQHGPLGRALLIASRVLRGPRVTIDGRCLNASMTGTQVHTLELIGALWRTGAVRLRIVVPVDLGDVARDALVAMTGIETVQLDDLERGAAPDDVVHRPYQVSGAEDMRWLLQMGRRVVITHQDLIAYRNPGYFAAAEDWQDYRRMTRETLALADRVLFFSEHAARDARSEGLVEDDRSEVVLIGADHDLVALDEAATVDQQLLALADRPFLLVLGTDLRHKNRPFALRVFERLREEHGWDGRLVMAGPSVAHGSSAGDEAAWLALHPRTAAHVVTLPSVSEAAKAWLLRTTAAVLYPTTYEGFGLLPFEAANAGRPCLSAPVASLRELLPDEVTTIVPWDAAQTAVAAHLVLTDADRAAELVRGVRAVAEGLTWDRAAVTVLDAYDRALHSRPSSAAGLTDGSLIEDVRYWGLRHDIGATGMSLVDPKHPLLPVRAQRSVAALARRRATRGPFLALLGLLQRVTGGGSKTVDPPRDHDRDDDEPDDTSA